MRTRINLSFTREVSATFSRSPIPIPNPFSHRVIVIFVAGGGEN